MNLADSFRAARWIRLINLLLQAVLFLALCAGLNYVAYNHAWRFDLTKSHRYSLSAETKAYLERLDHGVQIIVTLTEDKDNEYLAQSFRDIRGLLREYAYVTRNNPKGRIDVRFVNVYENSKEAKTLGVEVPNQVVLKSETHRRALALSDLYQVNLKLARKESFNGEAAITAAILDVSSPDRKKIYFVAGHGEMRPDDVDPVRGLSQLRSELLSRNFDLEGIDLSLSRKIPDDAALLIIASPQGRFQPYEEELLRQYLQARAGQLIIMLDPTNQDGLGQYGLENLFFDWGVIVYDDVIIDLDPHSLTENHDLLLWHFARDPASRITDNLINNNLAVVVGQARVVSEDLGRSPDDGLSVRKLIATSPSAWGETSFRRQAASSYQYTPGVDLRRPDGLGVMVISERVKPANLPLSVRGGRLVVVGTADLVTNNRFFTPGNLNLFLATINWTVERDTQLNIPSRPIQRFGLALSQEELVRLRLGLLLVVPGIVALLGLLVYWSRRN